MALLIIIGGPQEHEIDLQNSNGIVMPMSVCVPCVPPAHTCMHTLIGITIGITLKFTHMYKSTGFEGWEEN